MRKKNTKTLINQKTFFSHFDFKTIDIILDLFQFKIICENISIKRVKSGSMLWVRGYKKKKKRRTTKNRDTEI